MARQRTAGPGAAFTDVRTVGASGFRSAQVPGRVLEVPRISEEIEAALAAVPVLEIVAGPGSGKTFQALVFASESPRRSGVLKLTAASDPVRLGEQFAMVLSNLEARPQCDPPGRSLLILDDAQAIASDEQAMTRLNELIADVVTGVDVILLSQCHLPAIIDHRLVNGTARLMTEARLRLTPTEADALLELRDVPPEARGAIHLSVSGWPAGLALLATAQQHPPELREQLLQSYVERTLLDVLPNDEIDLLTAISILEVATVDDAEVLVGAMARSAWKRLRARRLPMIVMNELDMTCAPALLQPLRALLDAQPERARSLRRKLAGRLVESARFGEAAQWFVANGDFDLAAETLELHLRSSSTPFADWELVGETLEQLGEERVLRSDRLSGAWLRCLHNATRVPDAAAFVARLEREGRMSRVLRAMPSAVAAVALVMYHRPADARECLTRFDGDAERDAVRFLIDATCGDQPVAPPIATLWEHDSGVVAWGMIWLGRLDDVIEAAHAVGRPAVENATLVLALLWHGEITAARQVWDRLAASRRTGSHATFTLAALQLSEGDLDAALQTLRAGHATAYETGASPRFDLLGARIHRKLGNLADATLMLERCRAVLAETGQHALHEWACTLLGAAYLEAGEVDAAVTTLIAASQSMMRARRHLMMVPCATYLAEAHLRRGDDEVARRVLLDAMRDAGTHRSAYWDAEALAECPLVAATQLAARRPAVASMVERYRVQVNLFGHRPSIVIDGVETPVRRLKLLELAAVLSQNPAGIDREILQQRLFPDVDERRGGNHFRQIVFRLRQLTGLTLDRPDGSRVAWPVGQVCSDDTRFEALVTRAKSADRPAARVLLKEALELVTGPYLPASDLDVIEDRRNYLSVLFENAMMQLIRATADPAETDPAAEEDLRRLCERVLEMNPYSTDTYETLMRVELRAGDRAAMLATYRRMLDALREIGLDTPADLRDLVQP